MGDQVKRLRRARGLTGDDLAAELTKLGVDWKRSQVANLESGRRRYVTVDEVHALALILGVAPVHLVVPIEGGEYPVTPGTDDRPGVTADAGRVREWIRGRSPFLAPPEGNELDSARDEWMRYLSHMPEDDRREVKVQQQLTEPVGTQARIIYDVEESTKLTE